MKGMVLAAGFGTRFRPATYEIPKPMVPVCNRPLIAWAVDPLLEAGVGEIVVNLHHLPEALENYLRGEYGSRCRFHFSLEREILGTGGGLRRVRSILEPEQEFYLVNGDTIQFPPLAELREALRRTGAIAALRLRPPPPHDRFTPVRVEQGFVTGFGEGRGEALMFAGAHALSRRIFDYLPAKEFSSLTEDVYIPLTRQSAAAIAGVRYDGVWFDIGTPRRYLSASGEMLELMREGAVPIPPGSRLDGDSLVGREGVCEGKMAESVIGERSVVHRGARLESSVLWDSVTLETGVAMRRSILGHGVSLPRDSRVENALICRRLEGIDYPAPLHVEGSLVAVPIDPDQPVLLDLRGS